jgi:hypothetical protein
MQVLRFLKNRLVYSRNYSPGFMVTLPRLKALSRVVVRHLEVRWEGLRQVAHDVMLPAGRLLNQSDDGSPITSGK